MKVVINDTYGGFGISAFGMQRYAERRGMTFYFYEQDLQSREYRKVSMTKANKIFLFLVLTKNVGSVVKEGEMYSKYRDYMFSYYDMDRHDPDLVFLVETYGSRMNGDCAKLKVVEVPDDVKYEIKEYDGNEWVAEVHRTWS